jgi:aldose 1-epimerase
MIDAQFETVQLRDERAGLEVGFVPGAGMLCSSLRHRGEELLAQNGGIEAYAERGKTMGVPLLYPWANRLAGFQYTIDGRTVEVPHDPARVALDDHGLPIHGVIGGRMAWDPAQGSDLRSLTATLSWDESKPELFEVFPFRHEVQYAAHLADGRLEIAVTVHACGSDVVPVAFGFHPYLSHSKAPREGWQIELPAMRRLALDGDQIPVSAGETLEPGRFELAEEVFDDGFDSVASPARFAVSGAGRRIGLELLEGYGCAQVFAPPASSFICFEPMTAPANALRSGEGLHLLSPGERHRARFSISVGQPGS